MCEAAPIPINLYATGEKKNNKQSSLYLSLPLAHSLTLSLTPSPSRLLSLSSSRLLSLPFSPAPFSIPRLPVTVDSKVEVSVKGQARSLSFSGDVSEDRTTFRRSASGFALVTRRASVMVRKGGSRGGGRNGFIDSWATYYYNGTLIKKKN